MKEVQYDKIDNVIVQDIDMKDWPDFCDAYIESCDIDGVPATEEQLEFINQNGMFVHEKVWEALH
jgi:hypothetical protein